MMKSSMKALLIMISFLLIAGRSNGRVLINNNLFITPDNQSGLNPNLDSVIEDGSRLQTADGHVEKDVVQGDQDRSPRYSSLAKSATNENKLSFRLAMRVQKTKKIKAEGVFNLFPKGKVRPSGPSRTVNSMATAQELSTSTPSPGVGHMQIIRPKSQPVSVHILKSDHSHRHDHMRQEKSNKRRLGSTPSPGVGDN